VRASAALPGTVLSTLRSLPWPDRSLIVWLAVTAVPFAPPASNRQYASVPGSSSALAGRDGFTAGGLKDEERLSKLIGTEKRSTVGVSRASCAASTFWVWASAQGEIVSTSIVLRDRSKW